MPQLRPRTAKQTNILKKKSIWSFVREGSDFKIYDLYFKHFVHVYFISQQKFNIKFNINFVMFYPLSGALWRIKDCLRTAFYVNKFEMENSDLYNKTYFMGRMG